MTTLTPELIASLDKKSKLEVLQLLEEKARRKKYNQFDLYFPDDGPFRRELYPKHLELFKAGALHRERLFMAGNRVGKTIGGGYEVTCHLTGLYPHWWEGKRFDKPITVLAAGDTGQTTRDIIQKKMLGGKWGSDSWGTGMIPRKVLDVKPLLKPGIPNGYEEVLVKHVSGEYSIFKLRSYDQGREILQGFELDIFWPDEEIPQDVYEEGLMRTMTTQGIVIMTFTPLNGLTELVLSFMESMSEQEPIDV